MTKCGIRLRSMRTTTLALGPLVVLATASVLGLIGCGAGSNTYSPIVKPTGVQPGFSIAVSPSSVSVTVGNSASYTVTISDSGGFNTPVTLSASNLPGGSTATFGTPTATATGSTVPLSISTISQAAAQTDVASKLAAGNSGAAATRLTGTLNTTFTITGVAGGIMETATAIISVTGSPNFTVSLTPAPAGSNIVSPGGSAKYVVTVTSLGGFSSPVGLSLTGLPQDTNITFGSSTITPTPAGPTTTTVIIATSDNEGGVTPAGTYTLTLTGKAGTLTNTATAPFGVGSFNLTVTNASSGSGTVTPGGTANYIITLTSVNGFAPLVTLTRPALPPGCIVTFGSSTLTPTAASATTTMSIATTGPAGSTPTPTGSLTFDVGGQGGGWATAGSGTLDVEDFAITVSPSSQSTEFIGASLVYNVTVTSLNGYTLPVNLSYATTHIKGTTVTFGSTTITPTAAGASTTLTITNSITTPEGTFNFQVQGINGSGSSALIHKASASVSYLPG